MNTYMKKHEMESKLNALETLLTAQIDLLRRGSVTDTESLLEQAETLVEEIVGSGVFQSTGLGDKRTRLQKLYRELCLAVSAQKAVAADRLERVRKGKMMLGTYRKNV
jgi:hypothetical protein